MNPGWKTLLRFSLMVFLVSVLVCLPFLVWGESVFVPLFDAFRGRTGWLVLFAVLLLGADAVLPVPSAWVIIFLAQQAGVAAGILGGSLGLVLGVVVAGWLGRAAVGRAAPRFFPAAELARLRDALERHTVVTLACLRSVPVLAETSVLIAAGLGVPQRRIFQATLVPNVAIATIYAVAADDSFWTAAGVFLATVAASYLGWRGAMGVAGRTASR